MRIKTCLLSLFLMALALRANAQTTTDRDDQLKEIADKIEAYYIYEHIGKELSQKLKLGIKDKTFENLPDQAFADSLSSYLSRQGNDLHFNVLYRPNQKNEPINEKELLKQYDAINRKWNYGFEKAERLDGNIGYIQYTGFPEGNKSAGKTLRAAMGFISHTHALIIDLRNNQGGDGKMVELFLSYFFKDKRKLSTHYTRYKHKTGASYTHPGATGKKYLNKPVYILVNSRTISAAEAFAYNLHHHKKAIVIGEKTYGAANPVKVFFISGIYQLYIPVREEKNAITQTNWEHKGVDLDMKVPQEKALTQAHLLALEKLLSTGTPMELTTSEVKEKIRKLKIKLKQ